MLILEIVMIPSSYYLVRLELISGKTRNIFTRIDVARLTVA